MQIARVVARTNIVPWLTVPAAIVLLGFAVSGKDTSVDVNLAATLSLAIALTIVAPAAVLRILMDRQEKLRLRAQYSKLEQDYATLELEHQALALRTAHLEGRLEAIGRGVVEDASLGDRDPGPGGGGG